MHSASNSAADVLQVIPVLEGVVADFQKTHATVHLRKAALLLVRVIASKRSKRAT